MQEYRIAIQKLKIQIAQLEQENNEVKIKLALPASEELRIPQFAQILAQNTSNLYAREKVLQEMQKCCAERGMNLEMLFRCADTKFANQITVQEFKEFLDHFFQRKVDSQILLKVALLFDDDCSGIIMKEEFYRVLMYCKLNSEDHAYILNTTALKIGQANEDPTQLQQRIMDKFIKYIRALSNTAQGIASQIDYTQKGFICQDDLVMTFGNKGFGSNELFVIMKYFDIQGNNRIKIQDFIYDLKECINPNKTVVQLLAMRQNNNGLKILQELRKFRGVLAQYRLDPLMIFYQCQPKDVHRKLITDLAITFSKYMKGTQFEQIMNWMRLIDTSKDGAVDLDEFKMAILIEEDMATFQQYKQEKQEQIEPGLIDIVIDKIKRKQISLEQFFDWMDSDNSQTVSLIELRKGFIALNIDIGYVLKLLKLFDKNSNGQIGICDFYEAFGQEFKEETDKIIMRKATLKINSLFQQNKIDFVTGMKQLLYTYNQNQIITCEEFLLAMDQIKTKCRLTDQEIYKMMEKADQKMTDQINLNQFCNFLYSLM